MTYVQQIVVSAAGTHEDVVSAVALASVEAYKAYRDCEEVEEAWDAWLAGRFTKTVRESRRNSDMDRAVASRLTTAVSVGSAVAVAFCPSETMEPWMKRLRVTGLNRPRGRWFLTPKIVPFPPTIVLSPLVSMTTGKAAAQAAHGALAWTIANGETDFTFSDDIYHFRALEKVGSAMRIEDAGLTEVTPGTNTVRVGVL